MSEELAEAVPLPAQVGDWNVVFDGVRLLFRREGGQTRGFLHFQTKSGEFVHQMDLIDQNDHWNPKQHFKFDPERQKQVGLSPEEEESLQGVYL